MRKLLRRVLPVALVLCLALSQMSLAAWAIDSSNIDRDSAMIVTEDTTITGEVHQLVLVDAPVKVDVSDATLSVGIFVSPDAGEAQVNITGETTVAEVVVAAEGASVAVAETAAVESVTVDAPSASLEVAGEVKSVTVSEAAEGASVVVAETAKVSTLEVAAPNVTAEVAGTVETVTVAETAAGAELVVAETASVGAVTDATGELTVSGAGADSVAVEDTSAPAEEEAEEEEEEEETEEPADSTDAADSTVDTGFVDITLTPDEDEDDGNAPSTTPDDADDDTDDDTNTDTDTSTNTDPKITWGGVEYATNNETNDTPHKLTASDVQTQKATANDGYWVKFAVADLDVVAADKDTDSYSYQLVVKVGTDTMTTVYDSSDNAYADTEFIWIDISSLVNAAKADEAQDFIDPNAATPNVEPDTDKDDGSIKLKESVEDFTVDHLTVNGTAEETIQVTLTVTPTDENSTEDPVDYVYNFEVEVKNADLGTVDIQNEVNAAIKDYNDSLGDTQPDGPDNTGGN